MSGRDRAKIWIHLPRGGLLQDAEEESGARPEGGRRNGTHKKDAPASRLLGRALPLAICGDNLVGVLPRHGYHWSSVGHEHELRSQLFSSGD